MRRPDEVYDRRDERRLAWATPFAGGEDLVQGWPVLNLEALALVRAQSTKANGGGHDLPQSEIKKKSERLAMFALESPQHRSESRREVGGYLVFACSARQIVDGSHVEHTGASPQERTPLCATASIDHLARERRVEQGVER